jgi:glycine/sarcosine N-methyltransferase
MSFYQQLSKYYDLIFPIGKAQVEFIAETAGSPPKQVLDIACGAGGYTLELAKRGYSITAVDLDAGMVESLRKKIRSTSLEVTALEGNMLELERSLDGQRFDAAFCIGNSLVHLDGAEEVAGFLSAAKQLLTEDGKLILQIVNFDRILAKEIHSLPTIENSEAGLKFHRMYEYVQGANRIRFKTILEAEGSVYENAVPLYPIQSDDLTNLLRQAGFANIRLYGDFKKNDYVKLESGALVIAAS